MNEFDRPGKARALLVDPLFNEAFDTLEKQLHDEWAKCELKDREGQYELKLAVSVLKRVRRHVEKVAQEGKSEQFRSKQTTYLGDLWRKRAAN